MPYMGNSDRYNGHLSNRTNRNAMILFSALRTYKSVQTEKERIKAELSEALKIRKEKFTTLTTAEYLELKARIKELQAQAKLIDNL